MATSLGDLDHAHDRLRDPDRLGRELIGIAEQIRAGSDAGDQLDAVYELFGLARDLKDALNAAAAAAAG